MFFLFCLFFFFFSSRRRHTRFDCDWSSDVCSSDLDAEHNTLEIRGTAQCCREGGIALHNQSLIGLPLRKREWSAANRLPVIWCVAHLLRTHVLQQVFWCRRPPEVYERLRVRLREREIDCVAIYHFS